MHSGEKQLGQVYTVYHLFPLKTPIMFQNTYSNIVSIKIIHEEKIFISLLLVRLLLKKSVCTPEGTNSTLFQKSNPQALLNVGSCTNNDKSVQKIFLTFLCRIEMFIFSEYVAAEKTARFAKNCPFSYIFFLVQTMCWNSDRF